MRKILLFISVFGAMFLMSCDIETSKNGDLDGYWHLLSVDTLSTSGRLDLSGETVFWAFQSRVLEMRGTDQELYMRFIYEGNTLTLSTPHLRDRGREDPEVTEEHMHFLYEYGVNAKEESFQVLLLTSEDMTLQSANLQLRFRKQ